MVFFPKIGSKCNLQVQTQKGECSEKAECMINIRNTESAGGVRVGSDDPSYELLSSVNSR